MYSVSSFSVAMSRSVGSYDLSCWVPSGHISEVPVVGLLISSSCSSCASSVMSSDNRVQDVRGLDY